MKRQKVRPPSERDRYLLGYVADLIDQHGLMPFGAITKACESVHDDPGEVAALAARLMQLLDQAGGVYRVTTTTIRRI